SVMSRPNARHVGPTRRADSSTSMPPPDPRSSTVSPAFSSASAVGLPHPSDALSASSGTSPSCVTSYRLDVIGSQQASAALPAPQHELAWPDVLERARSAAWPY